MVTSVVVSRVRAVVPLEHIVALKTRRRIEKLMHVKSLKTQSPPFGVVWKFREGLLAQVLFLSLDHGSKLRVPSPIALVLLYSVT
ncbi:hypothetical protein TNCV_3681011 [Trichonephila clavipes]|uniref:Uncharacterized protein n=1 Tax=Trichonephila clavipes TaxID=2585209 RepID=A0A8X6RJ93_TRICX|nr:hypothetical protein TNCV_3681011 [Trichonephila clavipes]